MKKLNLKPTCKSDLERVRNMKDEDIDLSDIPEQGEEFFKNAQWLMPPENVTLTIDHDVLEWFKSQGEAEYSRRINAALRIYAEAHQQTV